MFKVVLGAVELSTRLDVPESSVLKDVKLVRTSDHAVRFQHAASPLSRVLDEIQPCGLSL